MQGFGYSKISEWPVCQKNALGLDFFILCCNHIFCKSLFAKKYVFIFSTTTTTVTWFEKKKKIEITKKNFISTLFFPILAHWCI